ncbi:MAG: NADP-dependent oxidoreductase [Nocardioidaceae bacterium]|nr:NADP-dependent oxidoreductase [Nocardioidaceae bacterium]
MRAIGVTGFGGGPDALQVLDVPEPHPGKGEVRVRVHAATVNPTDSGVRAGRYRDRHENPDGPFIPGADAAGVVDEIGEGSRWAVGDRVAVVVVPFRTAGGAYQDHVVVPDASVLRLPDDVDLVAGSTFLMNALTARLVLDELALVPGQTLAVTGAAGALGGYTVQMAKADGLRVVADASEADEPLVRSLGADVVVRRGDDVAARIRAEVPDGVDGLLDGSVQAERVLAAVKDGGRVGAIRAWEGDTERGIDVHRVLVYDSVDRADLVEGLQRQLADGVYTLRVADVLPAERAAEAHRRLEAGGVRGRLVLDFS